MITDDVCYVLILFCSLFVGGLIKRIQHCYTRQIICSVLGCGVIIFCCQWHSLHTLFTTLVNTSIIKLTSNRYSHILSFIWSFGYLAFFRNCSFFGIPHAPALANAIQLFLTLKCVGIAFEIHDSEVFRADKSQSKLSDPDLFWLRQKFVYIDKDVLWTDIFHYYYCYIGILTGPYFRYRVYLDFIHNKRLSSVNAGETLIKKLLPLPAILYLYLVTHYFFKIEDVSTAEFSNSSTLWKMFYIVPMFLVFRTRLYTNFILSECLCISAGLGAYPVESKPRYGQGPVDLKAMENALSSKDPITYDFTTIKTLDLYLTELGMSVRDGMRGWNMSVQYFQVHHVYRRFPIKSIRVLVVMTLTSYWHGLHSGYYLCFLTVPLVVAVEDIYLELKETLCSERARTVVTWVWWLIKMRQFEYMSMPFMLLGWNASLHYWHSVYYFMHLITVAFLLVGLILKLCFIKKKKH